MSNDIQIEKRSPRFAVAGVILLCFFLLFSGLIAAYVYKFDQQLTQEHKIHLSEISNYNAVHMTSVVSDAKEALKAIANAIVILDSQQQRMAYLEKMTEQFSFVYMGYAGPDGLMHATLPSESVDVSQKAFFQKALVKQHSVSDQIRKIFNNRAASGILIAVALPDMPSKKAQGVLVAMLETKSLSSVLGVESFAGQGYAYIIDKNGTVVMRTKSLDLSNLFTAWKNLRFDKGFSIERVASDVAANRSGFTSFANLVGSRQYAYYQPLPFNNWVVVNVISEQAVSAQTLQLTRELAFIGGGALLLLMALMFWGMHAQRLSQESKLAAEAKSAFLANMSHEIRTPMNAIVGLSEIMLRDDIIPRHRDQLTSILNSGKGLLTILNDILDISKIESGKFTIVEDSYELESLLYDITIIAAIRIGEKPLKFFMELDPALPRYLVGDMGRVKQVLLNIVGNAIKFTERGSIRLIINCEKEDNTCLLHVEVRDTGIGIKADDLGKMFVRFSQVDTKRNRNIEGTGLGLTISQRLCQMMGGHITVTSVYGQGSSFMVTVRQGMDDTTPMIPPIPGEPYLLICEESQTMREFEARCMDKLHIRYDFCQLAEEFEDNVLHGTYTHALASRMVLHRLNLVDTKNTQLVCLLGFMEHSLVGSEGTNIYVPLFASQLPYTLGDRVDHMTKRSSVTLNVIKSMPHVSVLIVDDNELNILVAEGLMAPYEMQIHHVYSGKEAIWAVQQRDYDLILMDHMMPEMDGVEATRLIRQLPDKKFKKLPIIALTANTTSEARQMFLSKGFNEFLSKPIETNTLDKTLREWLKDINDHRAALHAQTLPVTPGHSLSPLAIPQVSTVSHTEVNETPGTPKTKAKTSPPDSPLPANAFTGQTEQGTLAEHVEVDFVKGQKMMPSREFYLKICATYIRSTGQILSNLPGWMESDEQRVVIEVHGLKSASASIGAFQFSEAAKNLELLGKNGHFNELKTQLPAFLEHGQRVLTEIAAFLALES